MTRGLLGRGFQNKSARDCLMLISITSLPELWDCFVCTLGRQLQIIQFQLVDLGTSLLLFVP